MIDNSNERSRESTEKIQSIIKSKEYDKIKDIDTQNEKIICNVGEPTAIKFVDCIPDNISNSLWESLEQFYIYVIRFKCSFNGSIKEGAFKVNFLNINKPTVLDIFPKSVTEKRCYLKLGVHTRKCFEVKSDSKEMIFQYDELHPTIHGFTDPVPRWIFKEKQLEDEQWMHLLIELPKNIEIKNIMADLIAEAGDKCTNSLKNRNLIEKII